MNNVVNQCCYHCGEVIPKGIDIADSVAGVIHSFCCYGCQAVYQTIQNSGLNHYYVQRNVSRENIVAQKPRTFPEVSTKAAEFERYDLPEIKVEFVHPYEQIAQAHLIIDGLHCSACTWLIESRLKQLEGIKRVQVNLSNQLAAVIFDPEVINLSEIFSAVFALGYEAFPYQAQKPQQLLELSKKRYLRYLGVSGIIMMQVSMFSFGLYLGEFQSIEQQYVKLMNSYSLLLTTFVMLYPAQPFFHNAYHNLRNRQLGMEVPVSFAILSAYFASVLSMLREQGEIYFDTVSMFVFLLLLRVITVIDGLICRINEG